MAALERRKTCLDYRSGVFDGLYQSWVKKKNQYCSGTFCGGLGGETGIASGHMNRKWPPCVFSLRSDSFAFSLPALRLIACSDFHTGASAPALVWLSKQALVLFFSLRPRKHPALPGRSAEECLYAAESRHTHTHILTQPPPPTDSVLIYRWNATDSRPWTVLAAAEARSAPGSAHTRTAVLSPVGLTVRAALSFTRCHHTFTTRYIYVLPLWEGGQKLL